MGTRNELATDVGTVALATGAAISVGRDSAVVVVVGSWAGGRQGLSCLI